MPLFFFHIHDGTDIHDDTGTECANWEEAQRMAIRVAGDIISDNSKRMKLGEAWAMDVVDDKGAVLFHLDFRINAAAVGAQA